MDAQTVHCCNEGHLFHSWQRKIAFIKLYWGNNEVTFYIQGFSCIQEALLAIEGDPAADGG